MPAAMAPFASWISLTSPWVIAMSRPVPDVPAAASTSSRPCPPARTPGASCRNRPRSLIRPVRCSSATASTIPEPQMPTAGAPSIVRTSGGRRRRQPDGLDRPRRGAHAVADVGTLEGGAGRARGRREVAHPGPAQHDLRVGADVHAELDRVDPVEVRSQDHGDVVGAHEAADVGQHVDACIGRHPQAKVAGADVGRRRHRRHERRQGELAGRQAQQEVVHRRVAHDAAVGHLVARDSRRGAEAPDAGRRAPCGRLAPGRPPRRGCARRGRAG